MKALITVLLLSLSVVGCASSFSSIERNADSTYTITRVRQGFFSVSSNVYNCRETTEGFTCKPLN